MVRREFWTKCVASGLWTARIEHLFSVTLNCWTDEVKNVRKMSSDLRRLSTEDKWEDDRRKSVDRRKGLTRERKSSKFNIINTGRISLLPGRRIVRVLVRARTRATG